MDQPTDHVARPHLTWSQEQLTECGLPVAPGIRTITTSAFEVKVMQRGKAYALQTTCIVCWNARRAARRRQVVASSRRSA